MGERRATVLKEMMVTLVVDGGEVPEYGAAVAKEGEPAGTLTSPCESPTLGKVKADGEALR